MEKGYNGWTNYETWNAKLWIDNGEGDYSYWNERGTECLTDADGDVDDAVHALAQEMESAHDEAMPEVSGMYADLLHTALGRVEWREIAQSIVDDVFDDWKADNADADENADEAAE